MYNMYRDFVMPSSGQKVNNATNGMVSDMFLKCVLFGLCFQSPKSYFHPRNKYTLINNQQTNHVLIIHKQKLKS